MDFLVYGAGGYVGTAFTSYVEDGGDGAECAHGANVARGKARLNDFDEVHAEILAAKKDADARHRTLVVVNAAGRTRAGAGNGGPNNIDALEPSDDVPHVTRTGRFALNLRDNVQAPLLCALACYAAGVACVYVGSGCIFDNASHPNSVGPADVPLVGERDTPTFAGSAYSAAKGCTDTVFRVLQTVLNARAVMLRIRMPFGDTASPRSLVRKAYSYSGALNCAPNSVTYLPSAFAFALECLQEHRYGSFNAVHGDPVLLEDVRAADPLAARDPARPRAVHPRGLPEASALAPRSNVLMESSFGSRQYSAASALLAANYRMEVEAGAGCSRAVRTAIVLHVDDPRVMEEYIMPAVRAVCDERGRHGAVYIVASIPLVTLMDYEQQTNEKEYLEELERTLGAHEAVARADVFIATFDKGRSEGAFLLASEFLLEHAPNALWVCKMHTMGAECRGRWRQAMLDCVAGASEACCAAVGRQGVGMVGHTASDKFTAHNGGRLNEVCRVLRVPEPFDINYAALHQPSGGVDEQTRLLQHLRQRPAGGIVYPFEYVPGAFFWLNGLHWMPFLRSRQGELLRVWDLMEEGVVDDGKVQTYSHAMERAFGAVCAAHRWAVLAVPERTPVVPTLRKKTVLLKKR